jgi:CRP-like cAMP-binding protein
VMGKQVGRSYREKSACPENSGNVVLAKLSDVDKNLLKPHLQEIVLPAETVLCERSGKEEQVYFPFRGTVSLVAQSANGNTIDLAMVGRDGVIGCLAAVGLPHAFVRTVVNAELGALRIATTRVLEILPKSETLRCALVADAARLMFQVHQLGGCNAFHPIRARLARLLLRASDCLDADEIPFTQESMSRMLGVQRTTVNLILRIMADGGAVRSRRGHIEIINRSVLESVACECYESIRNSFGRAYTAGVNHVACPEIAALQYGQVLL